ncbi:MAG: VWA domain-containing protein, partial [Desulfovibrio sp.]|nr:VWA domain-containing protein [Desulfovibrio sp.]
DTTDSCWKAARECARLMRSYSGQDRVDGRQNQTQEESDRTEQAVSELARGNGRRIDKVKDNIEKLANRQLVADSARNFNPRDVDHLLPTPEKGMAGVVNEALDRDNPSQGASCSSADASRTGSPEDCVASGDAYAETPEERARADAVRSCLGRRLEALLQTQGAVRRGGARQGRRLDSRSLWKAGARDGRVFERTSQGHAPEAAVLVLMDQSGSMRAVYDERGNCVDSPVPGSQPIDWANAACSGLLDALRSIRGIQAGLCAFSNQYSVLVPMGSGPRRGLRVSATASGGTAIGRAIIDCSGMLPPQAKRKIMIVLTDGQEGSFVADAVKQANDLGVEVAGVGIGPAAPIARIVPVSRTVTSPDGIPDALCGVLRDLLVESGR